MKRTPESLFENIAQDNEVLQIFRHHSMRVMYLSSMLVRKLGLSPSLNGECLSCTYAVRKCLYFLNWPKKLVSMTMI